MSIVAMKRKTIAKTNISGSGRVQQWMVQGPYGPSNTPVVTPGTGFSINGGHRNQGYVGQTSLSRSIVRTPFRGANPVGTGGCCSTYSDHVISNCGNCLNNPDYIKPSVLTTKGMLAKKLKWRNGNTKTKYGEPAQNPTKPTGHFGEHTQSEYIAAKKVSATTTTFLNKPFDCKEHPHCKAISDVFFIGTQKHTRNSITRPVGPLSNHDYLARAKRKSLQTTNCCSTTGSNSKHKCKIRAGACATCHGHFEETAGGLMRSTTCGTNHIYPKHKCDNEQSQPVITSTQTPVAQQLYV